MFVSVLHPETIFNHGKKMPKGHLIPLVSFINISGSGKLLIVMCVKEADCVRICI